jgi:mannonate dehydratase
MPLSPQPGADAPDPIHRLGEDIRFVHFRDVEGPTEDLVETWQDEGPTDVQAAIEADREVGFEGPIRPHHVAKNDR